MDSGPAQPSLAPPPRHPRSRRPSSPRLASSPTRNPPSPPAERESHSEGPNSTATPPKVSRTSPEGASERDDAASACTASPTLPDSLPAPLAHSAAPATPPAPPPPPRHPSTVRFAPPAAEGTPSRSPSPVPPPPRLGSNPAVERKLAELEDLEFAELLDRLGDQLTDVRAAGERDVEYPDCEMFRSDDGKTDWAGFALAYATTFTLDYLPPGLIAPPPPTRFSFTRLRTDLERLYIICPPPVWQRLLLGSLSSLYRWENPRRTATWAAVYLALWAHDLVLVFPFAFFLYHLLRARATPPTPEELLRRTQERRDRGRDAAELGKQLRLTSSFGFAGEGVKGLWSELRERVSRGDSSDEGDDGSEAKTLANALGANAAFAGLASGGLEQRPRSASSASSVRTPAPTSSLARGLASGAGVLGAAGAPEQTQLKALRPARHLDVNDPAYDPARGPGGDDSLSLYRLARNLAGLFGPQVELWLGELVDMLEMVKNLTLHPHHPSTRTVILRLALVCTVLLCTPAWIVYKALWLYVGAEVFVLWHMRELYPEYRRATLPYWWLMIGAPTDVDYALFVLRQRNLEQRPLRGSKTLKRTARAQEGDRGSRSFKAKEAVRRGGRAVLRGDKEVLLADGGVEKVQGAFFALHASTPGMLRLSRSVILFTPFRRLRRLGRLTSRLMRSTSSSSVVDEGDGDGGSSSPSADEQEADDQSFSTAGTGATRRTAQGAVEIRVDEVENVKKESRFGAFDGLVVATKDGQVYRFHNVARRDDCFNKLLSLSSTRWRQS